MRTLLCTLACAASLAASGELSGRRAPGFSLPDMSSNQYDPQDYRGKILVVEFMQTSCVHCAGFSAILEEIAAKYRGHVAVWSIVNPPDNPATVQAYVRQHGITIPILYDCSQVAISYFKATPQHPDINVPHVFIIDAQGMIRNDYGYSLLTRGIFEGRELFAELDRMLGKSK
jgi:peroxiredoxin